MRKSFVVTERSPIRSIWAPVAATVALSALSFPGRAQQALYPQKEGIVQPFHNNDIPRWMTMDFELRGRTEEQTSLGYVSGKDRLYELTRVWGGMTVVPTKWLTVYGQFLDVHALGLPLRDTAANMRDNFDLRQVYLDFHYKPVQLVVGRQELRIGDERVVGISDWTNTSRTWDGAYLRIGNVNQLNIFTTSVVNIHPTSFDTQVPGLTFDGVHAKLATYVPHTDIEPFVLVYALHSVTSQQDMVGSQTEVTFGSYYSTQLPLGFESSGTGVSAAWQLQQRFNSCRRGHFPGRLSGKAPALAAFTSKQSMTTPPVTRTRISTASALMVSNIQATTMHSDSWTYSASRTSSSNA